MTTLLLLCLSRLDPAVDVCSSTAVFVLVLALVDEAEMEKFLLRLFPSLLLVMVRLLTSDKP